MHDIEEIENIRQELVSTFDTKSVPSCHLVHKSIKSMFQTQLSISDLIIDIWHTEGCT
jgi:F0F1-type ATP synthase gamma subunit